MKRPVVGIIASLVMLVLAIGLDLYVDTVMRTPSFLAGHPGVSPKDWDDTASFLGLLGAVGFILSGLDLLLGDKEWGGGE